MWPSEQKASSIIYRAFGGRHIPEEIEKKMVNDFLEDPRDREALLLVNRPAHNMHLQQHFTDRIAIMKLMNPPFNLDQSELLKQTKLHLRRRKIDDDKLVLFAKAVSRGALPQLTILRLGENSIGDAGVSALANAVSNGALAQCTKLYLDSNQIGDAGMQALAGAVSKGALTSLKDIYLNEHHPALRAACKTRGVNCC